MFGSFVNRSGPALLIAIGFMLISVGSYGWVSAGNDYERMQKIGSERLFVQALIEEFGSRAARRVGEDMSPAEQERHRADALAYLMADSENPIHASFKSERRRAILQLIVGIIVTLVAGRIYIGIMRSKGVIPSSDKDD